jgi:hypothetical protein
MIARIMLPLRGMDDNPCRSEREGKVVMKRCPNAIRATFPSLLIKLPKLLMSVVEGVRDGFM